MTRSLEIRTGIHRRNGNDLKTAALRCGAISETEEQQFHSINKLGNIARHCNWLADKAKRSSWADAVGENEDKEEAAEGKLEASLLRNSCINAEDGHQDSYAHQTVFTDPASTSRSGGPSCNSGSILLSSHGACAHEKAADSVTENEERLRNFVASLAEEKMQASDSLHKQGKYQGANSDEAIEKAHEELREVRIARPAHHGLARHTHEDHGRHLQTDHRYGRQLAEE